MTATTSTARPLHDESAAALGRRGTFAIYALVALRLLDGSFWALAALALWEAPGLASRLAAGDIEVAVAPLFWVLAAANLLVAVGLLLRRRWAWVILMLFTGFGLLLSLYIVYTGQLDPIRLAIQVATVLFLNQRAVRLRFGVSA